MQRYQCLKQVHAEPMTRGYAWEAGLHGLPHSEAAADEPGYHVIYSRGTPDEYHSWSPALEFEEGYHPIQGMTFGQAIEALKAGERVARQGWNGKGMWLGLHVGTFVREGAELEYSAYIMMKTADNKLVPWLASQTDMLAEDWEVLA